eukprot:365588-Chlamydomonas_euryale.AAC.4
MFALTCRLWRVVGTTSCTWCGAKGARKWHGVGSTLASTLDACALSHTAPSCRLGCCRAGQAALGGQERLASTRPRLLTCRVTRPGMLRGTWMRRLTSRRCSEIVSITRASLCAAAVPAGGKAVVNGDSIVCCLVGWLVGNLRYSKFVSSRVPLRALRGYQRGIWQL